MGKPLDLPALVAGKDLGTTQQFYKLPEVPARPKAEKRAAA